MEKQPKFVVPDGGWGWIIVAASALINMFNQSVLSVFGLLFGEHLKNMNELTSSAALITNLNCLTLNFSGFIIGPAIKAFTPRKVTIFGCLLTCIGLVSCSFSTKLWHIIIGYSFLVGIGLGLISPSIFMAINTYFDKRKGEAVGISMAGAGLGQMILPQIVRILHDNYGFKYTITVVGSLSLFGVLGALAFKPLKPAYNNIKEIKLLDLNEKENIKLVIVKPSDTKIEVPTSAGNRNKSSQVIEKILKKLSQSLDLELLKDPVFWSIIIGMALVYTSTIHFSMLFPFFLQDSVMLTRKDTSICMSVLAGADNITRVLLPFFTDNTKFSYRAIFLFGSIGMFVFRTCLAESNSFSALIVYSVFFGIMKSATVLNNNLTISDYCKPEKLPGGLGLNMISKGVVVITLGQILGWLRDFTGSYSICLHLQNILIFLVALIWLPELLYKYFKNRKSGSLEETDLHSIS